MTDPRVSLAGVEFAGPAFTASGCAAAGKELSGVFDLTEIGGVVTHRQRPATASGITFLNIEDETGLVNVICSVGVWDRYRRVVREAPALIVRGILERSAEGVTNVLADRFEVLAMAPRTRSRDFR